MSNPLADWLEGDDGWGVREGEPGPSPASPEDFDVVEADEFDASEEPWRAARGEQAASGPRADRTRAARGSRTERPRLLLIALAGLPWLAAAIIALLAASSRPAQPEPPGSGEPTAAEADTGGADAGGTDQGEAHSGEALGFGPITSAPGDPGAAAPSVDGTRSSGGGGGGASSGGGGASSGGGGASSGGGGASSGGGGASSGGGGASSGAGMTGPGAPAARRDAGDAPGDRGVGSPSSPAQDLPTRPAAAAADAFSWGGDEHASLGAIAALIVRAALSGPMPDADEVAQPAGGDAEGPDDAVRRDARAAQRERYVDLAAAESIGWHGSVAIVRVIAVIVEGEGGRWLSVRPARFAVALQTGDGEPVPLAAPWALPPPAIRVEEPEWSDLADRSLREAAARALADAGYADAEPVALTLARSAALPGVLRAQALATAPGEQARRHHVVWLSEVGPLAVLGADDGSLP